MNCFETNEHFNLVVDSICSQQVIFTKQILSIIDLFKKCTWGLCN